MDKLVRAVIAAVGMTAMCVVASWMLLGSASMQVFAFGVLAGLVFFVVNPSLSKKTVLLCALALALPWLGYYLASPADPSTMTLQGEAYRSLPQ